MIKEIQKSLVIWSFWMPFKRMLETISNILFVSMNIVSRGGQSTPTPPPPQPSCMLSFLCNEQRDWEEPGHLKSLNALQEDAGNNFSYLAPIYCAFWIIYKPRTVLIPNVCKWHWSNNAINALYWNMVADSPVLREIIKMYLSLNRDTLITFLSFVVIVACLYLSCMSSVMILC